MGRLTIILFAFLALLVCTMGLLLWWHNSIFLLQGPDHGFLLTKTQSTRETIYLPAFYVHVMTGSLVLILGIFQFLKSARRKFPSFHRLAGKVYAFTILIFTAPSGLIMSLYANGGLIAQSGFALLAILWWYFTWQGLGHALTKNWNQHSGFMFRSYSLTFAAVTLRLYSFLFALAGFRGEDIYNVIVWLSWVPTLLVVELYLFNKNQSLLLRWFGSKDN